MKNENNDNLNPAQLPDNEKQLLEKLQSQMQELSAEFDAQLPPDALADARVKMHLEIARQQANSAPAKRSGIKLFASFSAVAAILVAAISVAMWFAAENTDKSFGNNIVISNTTDIENTEITDQQLGLAWMEIPSIGDDDANYTQISVAGSGLGFYADSEGIFIVGTN